MKKSIPLMGQSTMKPMFDLNEMAIFVKVVQVGSFISAANALGIPKTTVSRKVAQLEKNLGARLLQRITRKLNLTEVGKVYFERCAKILGDIEEANLAIATMQAIPYGTLRISATVILGITLVNPWLLEFLQRYQQVNAEVMLTNRHVNLVAERIDVAFDREPLSDSSFITQKLGSVPFWVCASPEYIATYGEPLTPQNLIQHQCLCVASPTPAGEIQWKFNNGTIEEEITVFGRIRVNDYFFVKQAVLDGCGIAYLPNIVVAQEIQAGKLIRLLREWAPTQKDIYLVYPSDRHLSPKVRAFLDFVTEKITPHPPWLLQD